MSFAYTEDTAEYMDARDLVFLHRRLIIQLFCLLLHDFYYGRSRLFFRSLELILAKCDNDAMFDNFLKILSFPLTISLRNPAQ
jgi:hypothetical protein